MSWAPIIGVIFIVIVGIAIIYKVHQRNLANTPTVLRVKRIGPRNRPDLKTGSFTVEVKSSRKADLLLNDIRSLPQIPSVATSCPADDGALYKLTFVDQNLTVIALPTGCRTVTVSSSPRVTYLANPQFWKDLRSATGKPIDPNIPDSQYYQ